MGFGGEGGCVDLVEEAGGVGDVVGGLGGFLFNRLVYDVGGEEC